jgi:hypothetical protein
MKYYIFIFVCSFSLLVACGNSKKENKEENTSENEKKEQKDAVNEKSVKLKTEKKEFEDDANGYRISYEVITEGSEALKNNTHQILLKKLSGDYKDVKSLEDLEKKFKSKQYSVKSEYCENASQEFTGSFSQLGQVVSLSISQYDFQCGAHGLGSTTYYHFNAQTGKEITLNDVVKDVKGLTNEVEKQFCSDNKLKKNPEAYVQAGYDGFARGFALAKNYLFDKGGITFSYNPYEAGPYTLPPFDVKVSYDKIKPYLLENNPLGIN